MRRPALPELLFFVLALSGCPRPAPGPAAPAGLPQGVPGALSAALTIPPGSGSAAALERLPAPAAEGGCPGRWLAARYLVDLLDTARLQPHLAGADRESFAGALPLLWRGLRLPGEPGRGELATRQVMQKMQVDLDLLAAQCPEVADRARAAMSLLRSDLRPRASGAGALELAVGLKAVARSDSELNENARLRLLGWCFSALGLAAGSEPALMHLRIDQCLYPLFDADPSPYFLDDPAQRPPDPSWMLLADLLQRRAGEAGAPRLSRLFQALAGAVAFFAREASPRMPTPLDLSRLALPRMAGGAPWDRTPVVLSTGKGFIVGGVAVLAGLEEPLQRAIARRLAGDRRGRVTLAAPASAPADVVQEVGRAARLAGARTLELGVLMEVAPRAPEGEVQAMVFGKDPVLRLHGIPLSLGPMGALREPPAPREDPKTLEYSPRTAPHQLALRLSRGYASATTSDGTLEPPVPLSEAGALLRTLRRAYPEDLGLLLIPDLSVTVQDLAEVATAARLDSREAAGADAGCRGYPQQPAGPLFHGLALAPAGLPGGPATDLGPLLGLLSSARVALAPPLTQDLEERTRGCYLEALRAARAGKSPGSLQGTLKVIWLKGRPTVRGGTLRDRTLGACVAGVLGTVQGTAGPLTVTFSQVR